VCTIEAMKVFNEIRPGYRARIVAVLVETASRSSSASRCSKSIRASRRYAVVAPRGGGHRPCAQTGGLMYKRILVANRGEMRLRIIRACHELGVETVAIFSEADRGAAYLELADEAFASGPPKAPTAIARSTA
jgi:hypothetical protein